MYTVHHIDQKFVTMFKGTKQACEAFIAKQGLSEVRAWRGSQVDYINMRKIYVG